MIGHHIGGLTQMKARMQSALTKTSASGRAANRTKRPAANEDVGELLLAELAARRARLSELLALIRSEATRQMALEQSVRIGCRRTVGVHGRNAMRGAPAN
jgi:hypothetical protein